MGHLERECRRKQYDQRNKCKKFNAEAHSASYLMKMKTPPSLMNSCQNYKQTKFKWKDYATLTPEPRMVALLQFTIHEISTWKRNHLSINP